MGLDLTIYEEKNFGKDEKGRTTYTMVELENFRNDVGRTVMDYVGDLSSMSNCSTVAVDGMDFIEGLKSMKEDKATIEKDGERYANQLTSLEYGIEALEGFIEENELNQQDLDYGDRVYDVHLWY